eukprot:TRINITY_DN5712_c0_g1_i2.p1 TRINITY_DN5712_c0_g1~~TRINITY_DN5712_c0_g1_i2.p1  ORF type:complete len:177 (+),score=56.84 TRINITY_DN5712_c0_g1_i2:45-533(+)
MPNLILVTAEGSITIRMREDCAPRTCELVKKLVEGGHYDGCAFYRAEKGFCVQAGLRKVDGTVKSNPFGKVPLEYEVPNRRGTVAMARWDEPASGDGELFINLGNNTNLDRSSNDGWGLGFCVWGEVTFGMDVAERIATLPTHSAGGMSMLNNPCPFKATIQ